MHAHVYMQAPTNDIISVVCKHSYINYVLILTRRSTTSANLPFQKHEGERITRGWTEGEVPEMIDNSRSAIGVRAQPNPEMIDNSRSAIGERAQPNPETFVCMCVRVHVHIRACECMCMCICKRPRIIIYTLCVNILILFMI